MQFEFDPKKSAANLQKHGFSLEEAQQLWSIPAVEVDLGMVNNEYRYARLAHWRGEVHIAIFTFRTGPAIRLISARRASKNETFIYEQNQKR